MEPLPYARACWITSADPAAMRQFIRFHEAHIVKDKAGNLVFLAESEWSLRYAIEKYPSVDFHFTSELDQSGSRRGRPEWEAAVGA